MCFFKSFLQVYRGVFPAGRPRGRDGFGVFPSLRQAQHDGAAVTDRWGTIRGNSLTKKSLYFSLGYQLTPRELRGKKVPALMLFCGKGEKDKEWGKRKVAIFPPISPLSSLSAPIVLQRATSWNTFLRLFCLFQEVSAKTIAGKLLLTRAIFGKSSLLY